MNKPNPSTIVGSVLGLALRPKRGEAIQTAQTVSLAAAGGIREGGRKVSEKRGVTLLSSQQWETVREELKEAHPDLPWTARRANVLLDTGALAKLRLPIPPSVKPPLPGRKDQAPNDAHCMLGLVGHRLKIGTAVVEVTVETKPCSHIDRLTPGLRRALLPDGRGGVCCRVQQEGTVSIGDGVYLMSEPYEADA